MPEWRQWETTSEVDWTLGLERESAPSSSYSDAIEEASMRVAAALPHTNALAYTPCRTTMNSCKQFDYDEVAAVYGLSPRAQRQAPIGLEGH